MKWSLLPIISICLIFGSLSATFGDSVGQGSTTLTCIDKDGDGYGIGPDCTGVDADDYDNTVQTAEQAVTEWGTLDLFLNHRGYSPLRKWYISPTGNDTTCVVDDITKPCATANKVKVSLQPGDMVLYREGTYTFPIINTTSTLDAINGTEANPIVFMAYPGEHVVISHTGPANFVYSNWLTFDGFEMVSPTNLGYAFNFGINTGIVIRNNHCYNFGTIVHNGGTGTNITIEQNVLHNSYGEHCLYLGNHWDTPSSDIYVNNNILYNCATTGFQFNGPVTNLQFDDNIVYNTENSPISLLMGVSDSYFRNNVTFNSARSAVTLYDYNGNCLAGDTQYICPMPMTGNLFENNTFWVGKYDPKWNVTNPPATNTINQPGILFSDSSTSDVVEAHRAAPHDLGSNIFRNNIIWVQQAAAFQFFWSAWLDSTVIKNNVIYRGDGNSTTVSYGGVQPTAGTITSYTLAQVQSLFPTNISDNLIADPKLQAVDINWWSSPELFNLNLLSGSPAIGYGTTTGAPTTDIRALVRLNPPSAGAYEFFAQTNVTGIGSASAMGSITTLIYGVGSIPGIGQQLLLGNIQATGSSTTSLIGIPSVGTLGGVRINNRIISIGCSGNFSFH